MTRENINEGMRLREADEGDIPVLVQHHRKMFEEIWERKGVVVDGSISADIGKVYADKLERQLKDGTCRAWIIENEGDIAASGAISIVSFVPTPQDPNCDIAYLHSMYTESKYRSRDCATRIIDQVVRYCGERGIKRIILNASEAGVPVYERAGFRPAPDMMRLFLE